jgi:uncharacterized Ntn-hydrolase superfamily protein
MRSFPTPLDPPPLLVGLNNMIHLSTFSIVAYDPDDCAWGIAVASKFPAVGSVVPWANSRSGAVATQSYANTQFGPRGLDLMAGGKPASETLEILLDGDDERELRQVGLVDTKGRAATFTGKDCHTWAGGRTGEFYAIQGNILTGSETIDAMEKAFLETQGDLPERLLASLLSGDQIGGDRRGRQSAALFVVKSKGGYAELNDRWVDYRVDDDPDPVTRLTGLLELHRLYFDKSPEEDTLLVEGEIAEKLKSVMRELKYYEGELSGDYDAPTREALRSFIGNENFEDRTDFEAGRIDRPVYDYLIRKFSS